MTTILYSVISCSARYCGLIKFLQRKLLFKVPILTQLQVISQFQLFHSLHNLMEVLVVQKATFIEINQHRSERMNTVPCNHNISTFTILI